MTTTTETKTLLDAARDIGPALREHADANDREGELAKESLDLLREAGFLRLYVPRELGGLELDPVTHTAIQEELSRHDTAAGWLLQVASSAAWWSSRLPHETVDEIYRDGPDQIIAGSFGMPVAGVAADGGLRLTGRCGFASYVPEASWILVLALTMEGDAPVMVGGAPLVRAAFVPAGDVSVVETWDALGMRATESHDLTLDEVLVPDHRMFRVGIDHDPGASYSSPLYRIPAMLLVATVGPAVAMGAAREVVDEVISLAQGKTPFSSATLLRDRATAQSRVGRAEGSLRAARAYLFETVQRGWKQTIAGEEFTLDQRAELLLASVQALDASVNAVDLMYSTAGASAVYKRSRIERLFRDVQVLRQHGFINDSRFETVGQVRMGLPPDLGFVGL